MVTCGNAVILGSNTTNMWRRKRHGYRPSILSYTLSSNPHLVASSTPIFRFPVDSLSRTWISDLVLVLYLVLVLPSFSAVECFHHFNMSYENPAPERKLGLRRPKTTRNPPSLNHVALNPEPPFSQWDMQSTYIPIFPAFRYVSRKLAQRKLYIPLIISDQGHSVIPTWPISRSAQIIFTKIVRKACTRFEFSPIWMTKIAANSAKQNAKEVFNTHSPDSYLVRRSLIQHEIVFGGEGLTLLAIDHVYTFKHLLRILSETISGPRCRSACLSSCVELLHRINTIYTGHKPLMGYFLRVYNDIGINRETLDEVYEAYTIKYSDSRVIRASEDDTNDRGNERTRVAPPTDSPTFDLLNDSFPEAFELAAVLELPKFVAEIDSSPVSTWDSDGFSIEEHLLTVTYPKIKSPSAVPPTHNIHLQPYPLHRSNAVCSRCLASVPNNPSNPTNETTTILSSEWEEFREIGLGLGICTVNTWKHFDRRQARQRWMECCYRLQPFTYWIWCWACTLMVFGLYIILLTRFLPCDEILMQRIHCALWIYCTIETCK